MFVNLPMELAERARIVRSVHRRIFTLSLIAQRSTFLTCIAFALNGLYVSVTVKVLYVEREFSLLAQIFEYIRIF